MVSLVIRLDFVVDQNLEVVWRGLRSPAAAASIYAPLFRMDPVEPAPELWESGMATTVSLKLLGVLPLGRSVIKTFLREVEHAGVTVRVLRDGGGPITGPMSLLSGWNHQMAVSPEPDGRTRWRDRLEISGPAALLFWPALWLTWQWRRPKIKRSVLTWR